MFKHATRPSRVIFSITSTLLRERASIVATDQNKNSRQLIKVQLDTVDVKYKPGLFRLLQEIIMYHNGKDHKLVSVLENRNTMQYINKIYEH